MQFSISERIYQRKLHLFFLSVRQIAQQTHHEKCAYTYT